MTTALPASEHTEVTILGAMLLDANAVSDAAARLYPEDFFLDSHKKIFRAMLHMHQQGQAIDTTTLNAELIRRRELDAVGGIAYLFKLTEDVPRYLNTDAYAQIVKDAATQRELIRLHAEGQAEAADPSADTQAMIERTATRLKELQEEQASDIQHVGAFLDEQGDAIFERLATTGGIRFGFTGLDNLLGGVTARKLVIIAARPSMGKTAWACRAAYNVARQDLVTAFFSLEDDIADIVRRILSSASAIDHEAICHENLSEIQMDRLVSCRKELSRIPLYIDTKPKPTVSQIKSRCARLKRTIGLDLVIVDQLSKVAASDVYLRGMSKHEWVGAQTTAFKQMAQELNVPVVLFNQLNRESEKSVDQTPRLSHLKESGSIEEDADIVILLHRPKYHDQTSDAPDQMIVAKHRGGPIGTVDCTYQGRIMRWE